MLNELAKQKRLEVPRQIKCWRRSSNSLVNFRSLNWNYVALVSVGTWFVACCANGKWPARLNVRGEVLPPNGKRKGNYPLVRVIEGVITFLPRM